MPLVPCIDCGELTNATRCVDCQRGVWRDQDTNRPNTSQRGYGHTHRQRRNTWANIIAQTPTPCARCGQLIQPDDTWHLDHTDDRTGYLGPSHASCNIVASNTPRIGITNADG